VEVLFMGFTIWIAQRVYFQVSTGFPLISIQSCVLASFLTIMTLRRKWCGFGKGKFVINVKVERNEGNE
jgi:hypothetical protein